jgi:hypothetical protein
VLSPPKSVSSESRGGVHPWLHAPLQSSPGSGLCSLLRGVRVCAPQTFTFAHEDGTEEEKKLFDENIVLMKALIDADDVLRTKLTTQQKRLRARRDQFEGNLNLNGSTNKHHEDCDSYIVNVDGLYHDQVANGTAMVAMLRRQRQRRFRRRVAR